MDKDSKDKIVAVTGGAEGIGYAICNQFLLQGAKLVIILDVNVKLGREAANTFNNKYGDGKCCFIKCDVTSDLETVSQKVHDEIGSVDVLVNNAGVHEQDMDFVIDVNLKAVIAWSFKYWQLMRKDKMGNGGTIINVASAYGLVAYPHYPVYHASKFGVIGFTRSLGHSFNYHRSGVRVIGLCPGYTKTRIGVGIQTFDDEVLLPSARELANRKESQEADVVGKAAVEIYEKVESGTVWLIRGGKPIVEAPVSENNGSLHI